jgi:predicted MPP superfamily phosphohydrolase
MAFCGHTHGGQVRFPFVGALVTRSSLPGSLASGAFRCGPTTYVIGNGLGTSPATPFRLLCRPEAIVVELTDSPTARALTPIKEAGCA